MNLQILVNKNNPLPKTYIPKDLIKVKSNYKDNIKLNKYAYKAFDIMKKDALRQGYEIDIMSGYRCYEYQEAIYNKSLEEKGYAYTFRSIAKPGCSEHQTGLAIDICIYKNNKCYIEHELNNKEELTWLKANCHKYGFILRYPENKEDITGYNYEPWHIRYIGLIAKKITQKNLTLEEYYNKLN